LTDTRNPFADEVAKTAVPSTVSRASGDEVNRFFLCSLVSMSAKRIKAIAEEAGEHISMTMIVRSVLRFYQVAAKEKHGPLSGHEPDMAGIRRLNEKVLKNEIARHTEERVKNCETRLTRASRLGDEARIKTEKDALDIALKIRDRLASQFK